MSWQATTENDLKFEVNLKKRIKKRNYMEYCTLNSKVNARKRSAWYVPMEDNMK